MLVLCSGGEKAQKVESFEKGFGARRCALVFLRRQGVLRVFCGAARTICFLNSTPPWGCARPVVPRLLSLQDGVTALIVAAFNKNLDVVEALLNAGANVDLQEKVNTALTAGRTLREPRVPWFGVGRSFEKCSFCVREGKGSKGRVF